MATLHVSDLGDVVRFLPEIRRFEIEREHRDRPMSLFLCTLGFEPRCTVIPEMMSTQRWKADRVVYFDYPSNRDDNLANRPLLLKHLRRVSKSVQSLGSAEEEFLSRLRDVIQGALAAANGEEPRVMFDISVCANRLLMRVIRVLIECNVRLTVAYAEAAVYHPTSREYKREKQRWDSDEFLGLARGVSDVIVDQEFGGYHVDQLPDCVILLPGFHRERARAAISAVDPSLVTVAGERVVWLLGVPHLDRNRWRLRLMRKLHKLGPGIPQYKVSTFDYRETLRRLEAIYQEKMGQYRLTISPMGSKMQALGAALFCYIHPDVKVLFAIPREYNAAEYSEGHEKVWAVEFGSLSEIRRHLDSVGMLTMSE